MNQKRAIILIDGSNFYFKLKDLKLHHLLNFKFSKFINSLAKGYKVTKAVYFIGAIKTDGSLRVKKMHNDQQRLFSHLKVEYIGFSHKPSVAMVANCSTSRLLTKDELTQFIQDPKKETK